MNTTNEHVDDASDDVPPSDDLRAAEYVLGVLDAAERRDVQARIDVDSAFARLVDEWEERFASWLLQAEPVVASSHVWPRIRTRLGWTAIERPASTGAWNNVGLWRAATALAVAAGVAAVVIGTRISPPPQPLPQPVVVQQPVPAGDESTARPVTVLARDDGSTGWIASIDPNHGKVMMVPVPAPADKSGLVNELWVIPAGQAPISLGFVSNEKAHSIRVPDALRRALAVGATLAITLESQAGMPHAAPSGPIVAKGDIRQI